MSDIVETLRDGCDCGSAKDDCPAKEACQDAFDAADEIERLRKALRRVLIGGNHLATWLDVEHPAYTCSHDTALEHYGAGTQYDIWCCWKTIMEARAALGEKK